MRRAAAVRVQTSGGRGDHGLTIPLHARKGKRWRFPIAVCDLPTQAAVRSLALACPVLPRASLHVRKDPFRAGGRRSLSALAAAVVPPAAFCRRTVAPNGRGADAVRVRGGTEDERDSGALFPPRCRASAPAAVFPQAALSLRRRRRHSRGQAHAAPESSLGAAILLGEFSATTRQAGFLAGWPTNGSVANGSRTSGRVIR
jgi:hypothetical protein